MTATREGSHPAARQPRGGRRTRSASVEREDRSWRRPAARLRQQRDRSPCGSTRAAGRAVGRGRQRPGDRPAWRPDVPGRRRQSPSDRRRRALDGRVASGSVQLDWLVRERRVLAARRARQPQGAPRSPVPTSWCPADLRPRLGRPRRRDDAGRRRPPTDARSDRARATSRPASSTSAPPRCRSRDATRAHSRAVTAHPHRPPRDCPVCGERLVIHAAGLRALRHRALRGASSPAPTAACPPTTWRCFACSWSRVATCGSSSDTSA